jgi:hypothetical protein
MGLYDTLTVSSESSIDERIRNRDWQCNEKGVGATYRINEEDELESESIVVKENVDVEDSGKLTPDDMELKWVKLDDYNGPLYLNGRNYNAVLMIWDGIVKETKFNKIDFESIKKDVQKHIDESNV